MGLNSVEEPYQPGDGGGGNSDPDEITLLRIGNEECNAQCQQGAENLSIGAGILDGMAWGINGLYTFITDIGTLIQPELYPEFLLGYQPMSYVANGISSLAGVFWIGKDFMTGENYLDVKWNEDKRLLTISGRISQDSIITIVTNAVGWNLKEPNFAFLLDSGVLGYDYGRSGLLPFPIPAFIHPTYSFQLHLP